MQHAALASLASLVVAHHCRGALASLVAHHCRGVPCHASSAHVQVCCRDGRRCLLLLPYFCRRRPTLSLLVVVHAVWGKGGHPCVLYRSKGHSHCNAYYLPTSYLPTICKRGKSLGIRARQQVPLPASVRLLSAFFGKLQPVASLHLPRSLGQLQQVASWRRRQRPAQAQGVASPALASPALAPPASSTDHWQHFQFHSQSRREKRISAGERHSHLQTRK